MHELKMACVSDIHLGHRKNRASEIIKNLREAFPDNAETAELDILFIAGDLFDDLISLSDAEVWDIKYWVANLLRTCKKHDILVRVLEGTPSHDWRQSEVFPNTNVVAEIGADLKYVKELSIEYIERYGITVLYVPDEWEATTDKTLSQVHELLRAKGLTQVDYAIMHGQFSYQLPAHVKAPTHDEAAYLRIVKHLIFIGHVHQFTRYDRIIAQGSFDRLTHGDEAPKGHVRATVRDNGDYNVVFVENKGAKRFVTVYANNLSISETLDLIDDEVKCLPDNSFVRIDADASNPIFTSMEVLIRKWPLLNWSKSVQKTKEEENAIVEEETVFVPITLTRENMGQLLIERMVKMSAPAGVIESASTIISELL